MPQSLLYTPTEADGYIYFNVHSCVPLLDQTQRRVKLRLPET